MHRDLKATIKHRFTPTGNVIFCCCAGAEYFVAVSFVMGEIRCLPFIGFNILVNSRFCFIFMTIW